MTREEYKKQLLRRLYELFFNEGQYCSINIWKFSESINENPDIGFRVIEELKVKGFIAIECAGGTYEFGPAALVYCEEHKLADKELIDYQRSVRTKLLVALAEMQEAVEAGDAIFWQEWIQWANVDEQDFNRNLPIMIYLKLAKYSSPYEFLITPFGRDRYDDDRKRKRRADDFERLENLEGVTKQQRGHELEDLLADSAEWEDWEVSRRPRAQGTENDIIIHYGLHYFLGSCKWETDPIEGKEAELLESRVRRRPPANGGILFSMSGFTPNCIEEMRMMIASALIIPFGPADIRLIMQNEAKMKDLLHDKIDQVMSHRKFLIDGELK